MHDVAVIGAGVSGLACARALAAAGKSVVVLDKARGVGGRCATRRVGGVPVDLGPGFVHGTEPGFVRLLRQVPGTALLDWPRRVVGTGAPCHPDAMAPGGLRVAWAEGLTALPKFLAAGLDVRLATAVTAVVPTPEGFRLLAGEAHFEARDVVLALPVEQTAALLPTAPLPVGFSGWEATRALLGWMPSRPVLAMIVGYDRGVSPEPAFDVLLPDPPGPLQLVVHESAKRSSELRFFLVHANTRWSRAHLEEAPEVWGPALLAALAERLGAWAAAPVVQSPHRWRYARVDAGSGLVGPLVHGGAGGPRLGLCGEAFDGGSGVQGAFLSGAALGRIIAA